MEKGIIPSVVGGIGNELFIVSAAFVTSEYHKCPLYILQNPISNNKHNKQNYNYNESVFKNFGNHGDISVKDTHILYAMGYRSYNPGDAYLPWSPENIPVGSILESYYQYYPPLRPYENVIREKVLDGLSEFRNKVAAKLGDCSDCAFLHVRRGDIHENLWLYKTTPIEYFQKAFDILMSKVTPRKIYILSDEMSWVKEQDFFKQDIFELYETPDELETLALMSLCTQGAICGGQTFGWWGAYLGPYAKRNPIIYPEPSSLIRQKVYDLIPEEWTVIRITSKHSSLVELR